MKMEKKTILSIVIALFIIHAFVTMAAVLIERQAPEEDPKTFATFLGYMAGRIFVAPILIWGVIAGLLSIFPRFRNWRAAGIVAIFVIAVNIFASFVLLSRSLPLT